MSMAERSSGGRELVPSHELMVAMQRYGGGMEGGPPITLIGHNKMQGIMRDPLTMVQDIYYLEIGTNGNSGREQNGDPITTIVRSGLVSKEFNRAGDFGRANTDRSFTIAKGRGVALLQKPAVDQEVIEEFKAVKVNKGDKVVVPAGFYYTVVNIDRDEDFVVQHSGPRIKDHESDNPNSEAIRAKHGFAYHVVACDSHVCLQPNKNYERVKQFNDGGIPLFGENLD